MGWTQIAYAHMISAYQLATAQGAGGGQWIAKPALCHHRDQSPDSCIIQPIGAEAVKSIPEQDELMVRIHGMQRRRWPQIA